jgi:Protein of unknown function (DUF3006)
MKAVIDRLESGFAVLTFPDNGGVRVNVPVTILPPVCNEGDILTVTVERDETSTLEAKRRVSELIENLIRST